MKTNRRNFFKVAGVAGAGAVSGGFAGCNTGSGSRSEMDDIRKSAAVVHTQRFNMSGYAAPKLEKVRVGFVGMGHRGPGAVRRMSNIEGVEIKALCDKNHDRLHKAQKILEGYDLPKAKEYGGTEDAWKEMCESPDLDLIYIITPWSTHTPMAVYAMECGKHVAVEVPAAVTVDECWQLVETSEKTKKHCMMLENCCYDFFELLTLNMARQGFFGELVHAEGSYIHDLRFLNFKKSGYADMWRLKENFRDGNLYPTHGLGPVCQAMNINRGDKIDYLTSMSSNDFQMAQIAKNRSKEDSFFEEFVGKKYRGNMNTTVMKTNKGKTIMIQHDVTSPRPYSRIHLLSGTSGMARKWPLPERISKGHKWLAEEDMKEIYDKYTPEIVKRLGDMAKRVGGHGGMDFMMDWRLIDCLRNGQPLDQDVYDAALWSVIAPLSEWSVANRSNSIDIPDFTCGLWASNTPVDLTLKGGGTTGVRNLQKADSSKQLNVS